MMFPNVRNFLGVRQGIPVFYWKPTAKAKKRGMGEAAEFEVRIRVGSRGEERHKEKKEILSLILNILSRYI